MQVGSGESPILCINVSYLPWPERSDSVLPILLSHYKCDRMVLMNRLERRCLTGYLSLLVGALIPFTEGKGRHQLAEPDNSPSP